MHGSSPAAEIARSPAAWERLAKTWLVEIIERTPLADVEELPLGWISQEAAPLIAEILGQLSDPGAARDLRLPPAALERATALAAERDVPSAIRRLPRELAALQVLLIEALDRELPERDRREFARAVARLAEVFGAVQSAAMESLIGVRSADAAPDPEPGLSSPAELHEWLRMLIDEERRTGAAFSLGHVEVEGIERIAKGYGESAAARMVTAVAGVLAGQLSEGHCCVSPRRPRPRGRSRRRSGPRCDAARLRALHAACPRRRRAPRWTGGSGTRRRHPTTG